MTHEAPPSRTNRQRFTFKRERCYDSWRGKVLVWWRTDIDDGTEIRVLADNFWAGRGPIHWYPGYDGGQITQV